MKKNKKAKYNSNKLVSMVMTNIEAVVGCHCTNIPMSNEKGELCYYVHVYNKLDSTAYGRVEVKLDDLLKEPKRRKIR